MRLTFEAVNLKDLVHQMEAMLDGIRNKPEPEKLRPPPVLAVDTAAVEKKLSEPWPAPKVVPPTVDKAGDKRVRTEKQLANDEKLRERAQAKKAAGLKPFDKMPKTPVEKPVEKAVEEPVEEPEVFADPGEVVRIRQQTIEDLQKAYANGHQQEVFELLSRFGNGAKSFRELPPEAFGPIRDAINKGALT